MNMMNPNTKQEEEVTGTYSDNDLDTTMDSTTLETIIGTEAIEAHRRAEGNSRKPSENSQRWQVDPFKPRTSLCRSPLREDRPPNEAQDEMEDAVFAPLAIVEGTSGAEKDELPTQEGGEKRAVDKSLLAMMAENIREAKAAVAEIFNYAITTKNSKGLLREKSGAALAYLGPLEAELKRTLNSPPAGAPAAVNPEQGDQGGPEERVMKNQSTQTPGGAVRSEPELLDGGSGSLAESQSSKRKDITPPLRDCGKKPRRRGAPQGVEAPRCGKERGDLHAKATEPSARFGSSTQKPETGTTGKNRKGREGPVSAIVREPNSDASVDSSWKTVTKPRKGRGKSATAIAEYVVGASRAARPGQDGAVDEKPHPPQKPAPSRGALPRLRGEAISVQVPSKESWADVLRRLKDRGGPEVEGVSMVRKTATGNILVEFKRRADPSRFFDRIDGALGEGVVAKRLQQRVDLEIRDIEPLTSAVEVIESLSKLQGGNLPIREFRCKVLREGPRATKTAVVEVPAQWAAGILREGRAKIGWVYCRVRVSPKITRCFRCHKLGHIARQCTDEGDEHDMKCRKCGKMGHGIKECTQDMRCWLCEAKGLKGRQTVHIASSAKCPLYREEVAKCIARQNIRYGRPGGP